MNSSPMPRAKRARRSIAALGILLVLAGAAFALNHIRSNRTQDIEKTESGSLSSRDSNSTRLIPATAAVTPQVKNQIGSIVQAGVNGVSYTANFDRGWFDIELSGLPALPSARFLGYQPAAITQFSGPVQAGQLFTQTRTLSALQGETGDALKRRFVANLKSSTSDNFILQILDPDGSSVCAISGSTTQVATCDFEITLPEASATTLPSSYAIRILDPNLSSPSNQFQLESYVLSKTEIKTVFTGPGKVSANEVFRVRTTHNMRLTPPNVYLATFLRIYSAQGTFVKEIPVRFRWDGSEYSAMPLLGLPDPVTGALTNPYSNSFAQRSIHNRVIIDIPVNATSVTFKARRLTAEGSPTPSGAPRDVDLYVRPYDGDPATSVIPAASIAGAPYQATTVNSSATNSESITVSGANLTPGRWYVIPVSKSGELMDMNATVQFNSFSAPPDFQSGHYYNPSRSGHGAFLDFAGDQWVMVWYTYLQDGTPIWYYAAGPAPTSDVGNAIWQPTMYRVVWDGSQSFAYAVGFATVTLLGDNSFQFSYILNGEAGSEKMVRLGGPGCAQYDGGDLDATGHWYSPSKSGFGYSAQFEPGTEVHISYIYDGKGQPRWLYGQKSYNPSVNLLNMLQLSGFCPLCAATPTTNTVVGTMTRTLGPLAAPDDLPGLTNISVNATFAPPLSGTWNENLPVGMLSARKNCK